LVLRQTDDDGSKVTCLTGSTSFRNGCFLYRNPLMNNDYGHKKV